MDVVVGMRPFSTLNQSIIDQNRSFSPFLEAEVALPEAPKLVLDDFESSGEHHLVPRLHPMLPEVWPW